MPLQRISDHLIFLVLALVPSVTPHSLLFLLLLDNSHPTTTTSLQTSPQ